MMKVVYVMNVEWNWIKQRPQFIAERLSDVYDTHIIYQYRYNRKNLQNRKDDNLHLIAIKAIPKISGINYLKWINDVLISWKVKRIIKKIQPDCVFLTFPNQVNMIPKNFKGKIVYDCMDNHEAFSDSQKEKNKIKFLERKMISLSTNILVSSQHLENEIIRRYQAEENKITLVRNAYDGKILSNIQEKEVRSILKMAYIGTISDWFDWNVIIDVLQKDLKVELHLFGPIDKTTGIPQHQRIFYHGTVEHDKLYETVKEVDCLIMPFIINDIIKAVDPVKIYEYINFNKDIIMCDYDEVKRFTEFVYFYKTSDDFMQAVNQIRKSQFVKYSSFQRLTFLKNNSWENRMELIKDILEK